MRERKHGRVAALLPVEVNGRIDVREAAAVRDHVAACAVCNDDLQEWEAIAAAAQTIAARTPAPSRGVLDRVWLRIEAAEPDTVQRLGWGQRVSAAFLRRRSRIVSPLGAGIVAASVAVVMLAVLGGAYAREIFTAFQPNQFVAVPVTMDQLQSLPALDEYGTYTGPQETQPPQTVTAEQVAGLSNMRVATPGAIPSGIPTPPTYQIMPGRSASFTFSASKARAAAAAKGKALPPMPADVDGTTLQMNTGPAVVATYGGSLNGSSETGANAAAHINGMPKLIVAQVPAPVVTSNGASAAVIEQYLLAQPGLSPELANAIRAIGDPSMTLPVPIPIGRAASHDVQVQGVKGLAVADSTGLGGGVLWQKNGEIFVVAGMLAEKDLLSVANSLR